MEDETMKARTNVKAGALTANHNEVQVRSPHTKTGVKGGPIAFNHNQRQLRTPVLPAKTG